VFVVVGFRLLYSCETKKKNRLLSVLNIFGHYCPGDEFLIPANRLTGRELGGVFAFPDLDFFWADVAQNRPSTSGTHHRQ
jgi:hypothetical protein